MKDKMLQDAIDICNLHKGDWFYDRCRKALESEMIFAEYQDIVDHALNAYREGRTILIGGIQGETYRFDPTTGSIGPANNNSVVQV